MLECACICISEVQIECLQKVSLHIMYCIVFCIVLYCFVFCIIFHALHSILSQHYSIPFLRQVLSLNFEAGWASNPSGFTCLPVVLPQVLGSYLGLGIQTQVFFHACSKGTLKHCAISPDAKTIDIGFHSTSSEFVSLLVMSFGMRTSLLYVLYSCFMFIVFFFN